MKTHVVFELTPEEKGALNIVRKVFEQIYENRTAAFALNMTRPEWNADEIESVIEDGIKMMEMIIEAADIKTEDEDKETKFRPVSLEIEEIKKQYIHA